MDKWNLGRNWSRLLAGVVLLLIMSACSGAGSQPVPQATSPIQGSERGTEADLPPVDPTTAPSIEEEGKTGSPLPAEPTKDTSPEVTESVEATATDVPAEQDSAPPPVREGLAATDPSTVQLASGKVQLVEFFAYW